MTRVCVNYAEKNTVVLYTEVVSMEIKLLFIHNNSVVNSVKLEVKHTWSQCDMFDRKLHTVHHTINLNIYTILFPS